MKRTFKIDSSASLKACLSHIQGRSPGPLRVTVDEWKDRRSEALNRLMWLWYGAIQKFMHETRGLAIKTEDIHDELVPLLVPNDLRVGLDGELLVRRAQTSKMSNKELCSYMEKLEHHCYDVLGMGGEYQLPNPDDLKYRNYHGDS